MKHNSVPLVLTCIFALLCALLLSGFTPAREAAPPAQVVQLPAQEVPPPAIAFEVTPELLAMVAGVVLSLLFSYLPGLRTMFGGLLPETKRLVMLAILAISAIAITVLTCAGVVSSGVTCDRAGIIQVIWIFILAMIGNQTTFQISPQPPDVKAAALAAKTDEHGVQSWG